MSLAGRLSLIHAVGAAVLLATVAGGYRLAFRPAMEARTLSAGLRERLVAQQEELRRLPSADPPRVATPADPGETHREEPRPELRAMTPTVFLSSFESLAREVGLRVESSKELERTSPTAESEASGLRFEITGTGTFAQLVELCEALPEPLPGLEIRSLRVNRGAGEQVRWTLVCMNHDGRAG